MVTTRYSAAVCCSRPGCWIPTRRASGVCKRCAGRAKDEAVPDAQPSVEELRRFHAWVEMKGRQFGVDANGLAEMGFPARFECGWTDFNRWRETYGRVATDDGSADEPAAGHGGAEDAA